MRKAILIAAGTVTGLGAVLSITPPAMSDSVGTVGLGGGIDLGGAAAPNTSRCNCANSDKECNSLQHQALAEPLTVLHTALATTEQSALVQPLQTARLPASLLHNRRVHGLIRHLQF
jgi:Zn-dependent alcohol dehydrogenase